MNKAYITGNMCKDYASFEALNTIGSNLLFSSGKNQKILCTSCFAGEGKSYVSLHLAANIAKRGMRVALVDADLRRSVMKTRYKIELEGEGKGLANYLAGFCASEDEVLYETNISNLTLVPIGRNVANPIPLLVNGRFKAMLDHLSAKYDVVIVDAPPVGVVVDAAEMARFCDGAVLVVSSGSTSRRKLGSVCNQLEVVGCKVYGCILNRVKFDSISGKKYYKGYY